MVNILIVDDEPLIRGLIREHLEHEGFVCCEAEDGGAAPYIHHPGLTFAQEDLSLPFDGLDYITFIEEESPNEKAKQ